MHRTRTARLAGALALILGSSLASGVAGATEIHCEGNAANLKTYLTFFEVLFNERDTSQVARYYSNELVSHNLDRGGSEPPKVSNAAMVKMWADSQATFPDRKLVNDLILCVGEFVVARTTISGTMSGAMGAWPATGKRFTTTGIDIYRMRDGKVVERWGNSDAITMLKDVGLLTKFAEATAGAPQR